MHFWILYLCKICSRSAFFLVKITKIDAHASEGGVQYLVYVKVTYDLTDTKKEDLSLRILSEKNYYWPLQT